MKERKVRAMITDYEEIKKIWKYGFKTMLILERNDRDGWPEKYHKEVYVVNDTYYEIVHDRDGWRVAYEVRLHA